MSLPAHLLHDVTLVRPAGATDRYGNSTLDYGVAATRTTIQAWVDPAGSSEPVEDGRDPLVGQALLLTNHADVQGHDRLEDAGTVYAVEGPAQAQYQGPTVHHYKARLRAVTG